MKIKVIRSREVRREIVASNVKENINTIEYWDLRFLSNDWEASHGREQTISLAKGFLEYIKLDPKFDGNIVDFGCGLGDAIPVFKEKAPRAKFVGIDISQSAIDKCKIKYGDIATFVQGDVNDVPQTDVIIASNVLEHISDDIEIAKKLIQKCNYLFIVVPYAEFPLCSEHVNVYHEDYYKSLGPKEAKVFKCKGWTQYSFKDLWVNLYFKNFVRPLFGKPILRRRRQIMFTFVK